MIEEIFSSLSDKELKKMYEDILLGREEGLRPKCLDPYIKKVQEKYPLSFAEGWAYTEKLFWNEVGRRYFNLVQ